MEARKSNRPLAGPGDDVGAAELGRRVAENLRQRRKARGMSLDDLARSSGVSRAALSQIETCKSNPTVGVLWKIAVGLGVPVRGADRRAALGRRRPAAVATRRCCVVGRQAREPAADARRGRRRSSSSTSFAWPPARRMPPSRTRRAPTRCSSCSAVSCKMHVDDEVFELGGRRLHRLRRRPPARLRKPGGVRGALPQRHRLRAVSGTAVAV